MSCFLEQHQFLIGLILGGGLGLYANIIANNMAVFRSIKNNIISTITTKLGVAAQEDILCLTEVGAYKHFHEAFNLFTVNGHSTAAFDVMLIFQRLTGDIIIPKVWPVGIQRVFDRGTVVSDDGSPLIKSDRAMAGYILPMKSVDTALADAMALKPNWVTGILKVHLK